MDFYTEEIKELHFELLKDAVNQFLSGCTLTRIWFQMTADSGASITFHDVSQTLRFCPDRFIYLINNRKDMGIKSIMDSGLKNYIRICVTS